IAAVLGVPTCKQSGSFFQSVQVVISVFIQYASAYLSSDRQSRCVFYTQHIGKYIIRIIVIDKGAIDRRAISCIGLRSHVLQSSSFSFIAVLGFGTVAVAQIGSLSKFIITQLADDVLVLLFLFLARNRMQFSAAVVEIRNLLFVRINNFLHPVPWIVFPFGFEPVGLVARHGYGEQVVAHFPHASVLELLYPRGIYLVPQSAYREIICRRSILRLTVEEMYIVMWIFRIHDAV